MKQGLLVVGLVLAISNVASAQGMEIHNRLGPSGTHFQLPAQTQQYVYEATICGGLEPYNINLDVYHNGVLKASYTKLVGVPSTNYEYSETVSMSTWGLLSTDCVTFTCSVTRVSNGTVLATDHLYGDLTVPMPVPLPLW